MISTHPRLLRNDGEHSLFSPSNHGERRAHAYLLLSQNAVQLINAGDWLVAVADDNVPFQHAGPLRRTADFDGNHQNPSLDPEVVKADDTTLEGNVLASQADVAAPDFAFLDELPRNKLRRIDTDSETDALSGQNDGGVDADHFPSRVGERPARVAGVQRRIGLDNVVHHPA